MIHNYHFTLGQHLSMMENNKVGIMCISLHHGNSNNLDFITLLMFTALMNLIYYISKGVLC